MPSRDDGAPARPPADADIRAEKIIEAAYRLLNEHGLEGLTVRAVLKATGYNRRAFYDHFADKDQLMLAVFARSIERVAAECRMRIAALPAPLERLRFIIGYLALSDAPTHEEFGRNVRRGSALCREHMRLAEARPDALRVALRPLVRLMSEQLADGMASGRVRRDDPEGLAGLVYNLVSTTVHAAVLAQEVGNPDPVQQARLAERIWTFCLGGISP